MHLLHENSFHFIWHLLTFDCDNLTRRRFHGVSFEVFLDPRSPFATVLKITWDFPDEILLYDVNI